MRRPRDAVAICQRLLADDRLPSQAVAAGDGHRTVRADILIADRLKSIVAKHGRSVYEPFDLDAKKLLERGKGANDTRLLELVCRNFPEASVVPDALLALGLLYEREKKLADASRTYKRLQTVVAVEDRRVQALWRPADVYEERQLLLSARDSYFELLRDIPKSWCRTRGARGRSASWLPRSLHGRRTRQSPSSVRSRPCRCLCSGGGTGSRERGGRCKRWPPPGSRLGLTRGACSWLRRTACGCWTRGRARRVVGGSRGAGDLGGVLLRQVDRGDRAADCGA